MTWDLTDYRGSAILSYTITFRESDNLSYSESKVTCDGTQTDILTGRTCSVPKYTFIEAPFNLPWGSSIYAIITATNAYGTSVDSEAGNGAIILTVPDAPINLANVPSITAGAQIGLVWEDDFSDGGTPIIDYRVWTDQGNNIFMPFAAGITT